MEKIECQHAPICAITWQHGPTLQFDYCAKKHSLCGTVMIHDGLKLTCLDQCHGVCSHGTSFSLAQKEVLYSLNLIHEFTSLFSPKVYNFCRFAQEGLPRKQAFVDISVFLWLGKQRPRFAQGQPKGYLQLKELHRTTNPDS